MSPQIREVTVDRLSLFGDGLITIAGHAAGTAAFANGDPTVWLRLSKRNTQDFRLISGTTKSDPSGQIMFHFELNLRDEANVAGEDICDAHLIFKTEDGDVVERLPWPEAFGSWLAYPTIYGNLSVKRANGGSKE